MAQWISPKNSSMVLHIRLSHSLPMKDLSMLSKKISSPNTWKCTRQVVVILKMDWFIALLSRRKKWALVIFGSQRIKCVSGVSGRWLWWRRHGWMLVISYCSRIQNRERELRKRKRLNVSLRRAREFIPRGLQFKGDRSSVTCLDFLLLLPFFWSHNTTALTSQHSGCVPQHSSAGDGQRELEAQRFD